MDQILDNFVGGHGKYQIAITIATSLINEFANGIFLMHIFTAYAPKHRCRVPQCETINATKVSLTFFYFKKKLMKIKKNQICFKMYMYILIYFIFYFFSRSAVTFIILNGFHLPYQEK